MGLKGRRQEELNLYYAEQLRALYMLREERVLHVQSCKSLLITEPTNDYTHKTA